MTPATSLEQAQAARRHEEDRTAQARPVKEQLDRIERENDVARRIRASLIRGHDGREGHRAQP